MVNVDEKYFHAVANASDCSHLTRELIICFIILAGLINISTETIQNQLLLILAILENNHTWQDF